MTSTSSVQILALVSVSLVLHIFAVGGAAVIGERMERERPQKVKLKVRERKVEPKPEPAPPPPPAPMPPPPKPEPIKPKPKKPEPDKVKTPPPNTTAVPPAAEPPKPIQGLSKDSFTSGPGPGISAPVGNTTMMADEGKRLRPDEVSQLKQDLSAKARLLASSIRAPEYTAQAIDAGLEGNYKVEVYVDATGKVVKAELPKKVGYQMDQRLIEAAMGARFEPRKNELGQGEAGWTEITFSLQLP